jgi:CheY-like chemotaxis protein
MKKILVLEGDPSVGVGIKRYLESMGYHVELVTTNDDAIALITAAGKANRFDGAVIDGSLKLRHDATEARDFDTGPTIIFLLEAGTPVILAASGHDRICDEMMKAGCTHSVEGEKSIVHRKIAELVPLT